MPVLSFTGDLEPERPHMHATVPQTEAQLELMRAAWHDLRPSLPAADPRSPGAGSVKQKVVFLVVGLPDGLAGVDGGESYPIV